MIEIVLMQPEMPANVGNIGRTALLTGSRLHLVHPYYFRMDDKQLKRSGMDYWAQVDWMSHVSIEAFEQWVKTLSMEREAEGLLKPTVWLIETDAPKTYRDVSYRDGDILVFGNESHGLPQDFIDRHALGHVSLPMVDLGRSLNLSNTVAIATYEALAQIGFPNMK